MSSEKSICLNNFWVWFYLLKIGGHSVFFTIKECVIRALKVVLNFLIQMLTNFTLVFRQRGGGFDNIG